ncbi:hypothetical protein Tco_1008058, partial [Tanacetum coccineum]
MSMMGKISFFLGLQILQNPRGIFINKSKYALESLKKYGFDSCDPVDTPMVEISKLDEDNEGKAIDPSHYRGMIGTLLYLIASRPDLQFAICMCARYQARPTEEHLHTVKGIFRYLRGTVNQGLWYPKDSSITLTSFGDSDHDGCQDTRRSTSGSLQILGDKLVSWSSKRQKSVAISSTEADYIAMSGCCAQILWMRSQLTDYGLGFNKILMYRDNKISTSGHLHKSLARERIEFLINKLGMRCFMHRSSENRFEMKLMNSECMLQICPKLPGQQFVDPPFEEDILTFMRELGYPGNIKLLFDVKVDTLPQPWRTFGTIINKCLSGKVTGIDTLRLSRAQILWGLSKTEQAPKPSTGKRVKAIAKVAKSGKKKQPAPGLETLSDIALTKAKQMKIATKQSLIQTHSSHASGSVTHEGIDDDDDNEGDDDAVNDDHDDADNDSERTESENEGDVFVHPKFTTHEEEESSDLRVHTPSQSEPSDNEENVDVAQSEYTKEEEVNV